MQVILFKIVAYFFPYVKFFKVDIKMLFQYLPSHKTTFKLCNCQEKRLLSHREWPNHSNNLFFRKVKLNCAQATELKDEKNHKLKSSIKANYQADLKTTNQTPEITSRPTRIPIQLKPFRVSRENSSDFINLLKRPLPT